MSKEIKGLNRTITLWNESRLDLFAISLPDKNYDFHGVIRFYHQDSTNDGKYATKCVRVSSTAATVDVIDTLSEKFRADMRMLTKPNYALYEVHADGETRKLEDNENPLIVQLGWIKDDREGRFLLRNEDDKYPVHVGNGLYEESEETIKGFKLTRNLTKKEKKQKKKEDKEKLHQKNKNENVPTKTSGHEVSAAKQLYNEVPESTFTRTVSNPEAVMKKRREQKLQKRGAEMLKVYGDSINAEIPYKTLLLLPTDKTDTVIRDTLDKYGMGKESTADYMMVQVVLPPGSKPEECFEGGWGKETILIEDECPLDIEQKWQPHQGTLVFQLRVRTESSGAKKKKTPSETQDKPVEDKHKQDRTDNRNKRAANNGTAGADKRSDPQREQKSSKRPKLIELLGSGNQLQAHDVVPNVTEIGNDRRNAAYGPFIELRNAPGLLSSHCVITNMDGVVTVTPHDGKGEVFVNGKVIEETTMLSHGAVLWLGRNKHLVFCDPGRDISPSEIQKAVRAIMVKEQRSHKPPQNRHPSGSSLQRERPGSDGERPRHYSTTSTSSSKSGSLSRGGHPGQERAQLQNIPENRNHQRPPQQRKAPPTHQQPLPHEGYHQRSAAPPQTAAVQPVQQRKPQRLPVYLQVNRDAGDPLITEILSVRANHLHFKLSPAYSVYLMQRYFVTRDRSRVAPTLTLVTDLLEQTVQVNCASVSELSFWMANTSELLNFIRQDQDLTSLTIEMQDTFAKTVQLSFRHLVQCMQRTLFDLMPAFLSDSDEDLPGGGDAIDLKKQNQNSDDPTMYDILHMLSSAMSLLRKCRVNAALTIQLFSQLFHSINMWLFNKLVASRESRQLCCREWGMRIRARLAMVETWAEKQGLELAADCHLARITQATHLLQAPKQSGDDIAAISGTCFKLNSLQLRALLSNYQPRERDGEHRISQELIDKVVSVAENSADELTRADGRDVSLEEDPDLQLPFLLPEDGYSCDVVRGVPTGLTEFMKPFVEEGFCTYQEEAKGSDSWTVHFQSYASQPPYQNTSNASLTAPDHSNLPPHPEVINIQFHKRGGGMGLSIVAARGAGQDKLGIYIRSVVQGGASDLDGRLQAGDQLLSVDGQTLVGVDQARAAALMTRTGQTVTLEIAKQGAVYHGLATLLSQPSPQMQHPTFAQRRMNTQPRPKSEGYSLNTNPSEPSRQKPASYAPHNPSYAMQGRPFTSQNKQPSALNSSTPHLNKGHDYETPRQKPTNAPRPAMSMGNLQQTNQEANPSSPRGWRRNKEVSNKPAESSTISNMRRKATSQTTLPTSFGDSAASNKKPEEKSSVFDKRSYPRKQISSPPYPPSENLPSPPLSQPPPSDPMRSFDKYPQNALDNPNYDHFPPPPPDLTNDNSEEIAKRHFQPVKPDPIPPPAEPNKNAISNSHESPAEKQRSSSPPLKKDARSPVNKRSAQTLGRPSSGKKPEVARVTPTQKKKQNAQATSKSSTLPRHFKSASPWERDERDKKEQSIQEQLNALRDEEISELTARTDLSPLEEERLKSLLQERDFQARVQEERMRMFSDEDISEEDYNSVPDRPDRDRLIRLEGAHAQRNSTSDKEDKDRVRWEEEQKRKKEEAEIRAKLEAVRREERRRERERQEEKRRKEAEQRELQKQNEEKARIQREKEREEEKWRYELQQQNEEKARIQREEEKWRYELQKQNEEKARIQREKEREDEKWMNDLQREEEEQRRRLEELRRMREEEENQLREIQAKREAEERSLRYGTLQRREKEKLMKQKEADAREEAEREYLEAKLSAGKPTSNAPSFKKHSPYSPRSFTAFSSGENNRNSSAYETTKPVMRDNSKSSSVRPVSDGYMLGKTDWSMDDLPPPPEPTTPTANYGRRPISYVASSSTPGVIGSQEIYNDPRNKREATMKRDQSFKRRGPDPSRLTFKDRQRMFQGESSSPATKPKSSRRLMEIEENLRGQH